MSGSDRFFSLVFALSTGAFVLVLTLLRFVPKGVDEGAEQATFAIAWPIALLAAALASRALHAAQRRWLSGSRLFFPLFGLSHTAFWVGWIAYCHVVEVNKTPTRGHDLAVVFLCAAIGYVALTTLLVSGFVVGGSLGSKRRGAASEVAINETSWVTMISGLLTVGGLAAVAIQFSETPYSVAVIGAFFIVGAAFTVATRAWTLRVERRRTWISSGVFVFIALILVLWFPQTPEGMNGNSPSDFATLWRGHYMFFLGPVEGILQGRSPLVDVNSQYGVGVVYFIALVFKLGLVDRSTHGLAHIICALEVLRYFLLYAALKRITRSVWPAVLFLALGLANNFYEHLWSVIRLPNQGPLRFIAEYTLIVGLAFQPPGRLSRRYQIGLLGLVVLGTLWSLDMAVATLGAYLGTRALVAVVTNPTFRARAYAFGRDLGVAAATVASALALLALYVRASAGAWPIWSRAFEYAAYYRTWTYWTEPMDTWGAWLPVGLVYLASIVAVLQRMDASVEAQTVLAMSLVGIADMNYYVGRSYLDNLAAVSLPAIFLSCYWFSRLQREATGAFRFAGSTAAFAAALLVVFSAIPGFTAKFPYSLLVAVARADKLEHWTHDPAAVEAAGLMRKYVPEQRRVAVFLSQDVEVEALLMARKTQMWPVGFQEQDHILPRALRAAIEFDPPLQVGDYVFDGPNLASPAREGRAKVGQKFELSEVEKTATGIRAWRITKKL